MKRKKLLLLTSLLLTQTTAVLGMTPNEERVNTARSAPHKFVVDTLVQETKGSYQYHKGEKLKSYRGKLVTPINKAATASWSMTRPSTKNLPRAITFSKGIFTRNLPGDFEDMNLLRFDSFFRL